MSDTGGPISEADRRAYASARMKFELEGLARLKPAELAGIERCRRKFEALGPRPQVTLLPSKIPGAMDAHVEPASERHARIKGETSAMAAAWAVIGAEFIGPRRRGCIQRDENGDLVMDMEGARTRWPTGGREAAERREAPAAPAAGGV